MTAAVTKEAETRGGALKRLATAFAAAGLETPQLDARLLLAHVLGVEQLDLLTERDDLIPAAAQTVVADVLRRRLAREPVSRIVGERWFYGRPFVVTPATLDPRPDSETLIDAALELIRDTGLAHDDIRILDIGTGTGCLLLTLLCELPGAQGCGTDVSAAALAVASENERRLKGRLGMVEHTIGPIDWRQGAGVQPVRGATFNLIISNPPYIPRADIAGLDAEVRHFDPMLALDGGADGLDVYRDFALQVPDVLTEGWVLFEVGVGQAEAVAALLTSAFLPAAVDVRLFQDLAGVQRCVAVSPRKLTVSQRY